MNNTLSDLIELMLKNKLDEFHTCMPGKIVSYNPVTQEASVQPLIKKRYYDDVVEDQPVIAAVPVIFPSAAGGILSFPIKAGDKVLILFNEVSLDAWLYSDGKTPVDPNDYRRAHYADAVCIPGLYPLEKAVGSHPTDVVLRFNAGTAQENSIALKPSGDVVITSPTNITTNATGDVEIVSSGDTNVSVGGNSAIGVAGDLSVESLGDTSVDVSGTLTITCPTVNVSGDVSVTGDVSSTGDIETSSVFKVDGLQVVGPQQPTIIPATNAATVITQFNLLLAACKVHGLIAGP